MIAVGSIFLLLGGSGAAALYIGTDKILGKSEKELGGLDCKDVARIAIKRNDNQIWLHKYVKTDSTDGPTRIKTAIRVATGMAEKLRADMIHIVVLDQNGPTKRSDFKDLAFGAEVFYVRKVGSVPGFENTFTATYAVGSAAANGNFYGKRRELTSDQVLTLARFMDDRADCLPTDEEKAKMDAAAKAAESHKAKASGEKKPEEGPKPGEEKVPVAPADPALAAEAKLDEALGIVPPPPPPVEEAKAEPDAKKDKGFLDSMLGMVGLGSKEEAPKDAAGHAAPAEGHPAPVEGHATPSEGEGHAAPAEGEGQAAPGDGEHPHEEKKLPPSAVDLKIPDKPVVEKSMFSSLMGMVGLGGDDKTDPPATGHDSPDAKSGGHPAPSAEIEGLGSSSKGESKVEGKSSMAPDHAVASEDHGATEQAADSHTTPTKTQSDGSESPASSAPAEEPTDEELAKMKAVAEPHQ